MGRSEQEELDWMRASADGFRFRLTYEVRPCTCGVKSDPHMPTRNCPPPLPTLVETAVRGEEFRPAGDSIGPDALLMIARGWQAMREVCDT